MSRRNEIVFDECPIVKFAGKTQNVGGDQGTKYAKKHLRAYGMPGTANGVCVKVRGLDCACGGCGA